ncbi:hypothetical protein AYO43_11090 [Nitrospira sp. SCGC AG-212-E16]|nr:hypothetical protein AYO43_11090 [Nitrospira sp. SCGC AG-212-E16]
MNQSQLLELPIGGNNLAENATIEVSISLNPQLSLSEVLIILSAATLTILPGYSDTAEYLVHYDVLVQGERMHRYSYVIRQRLFLWFFGLLAAPWWDIEWKFVPFPARAITKSGQLEDWVQFASASIAGTAYLFLEDARRDRVLAR